MKKNEKKIVVIILLIVVIMGFKSNVFAEQVDTKSMSKLNQQMIDEMGFREYWRMRQTHNLRFYRMPDGIHIDPSKKPTWEPKTKPEPKPESKYPVVGGENLRVYQPDGTQIRLYSRIYSNGYTYYTYSGGHTAILDTLTGNWMFAIKGENGFLESSGYPVHLHNGRDLGIELTIKPSEEEIEAYQGASIEDDQTFRYNAPYNKMPSSIPVKSLVIYVTLVDDIFDDVNFVDTLNFFEN